MRWQNDAVILRGCNCLMVNSEWCAVYGARLVVIVSPESRKAVTTLYGVQTLEMDQFSGAYGYVMVEWFFI